MVTIRILMDIGSHSTVAMATDMDMDMDMDTAATAATADTVGFIIKKKIYIYMFNLFENIHCRNLITELPFSHTLVHLFFNFVQFSLFLIFIII